MEKILMIILAILTIAGYSIFIGSEIRSYLNSIPDGSRFIKKFAEKADTIARAQKIAKVNYFLVSFKDLDFKVAITSDAPIAGITNYSQSIYKNKCIYINNEAVCRIHIVTKMGKENIFLEWSDSRRPAEIAEIIDEAYSTATYKIKMSLNTVTKTSFY